MSGNNLTEFKLIVWWYLPVCDITFGSISSFCHHANLGGLLRRRRKKAISGNNLAEFKLIFWWYLSVCDVTFGSISSFYHHANLGGLLQRRRKKAMSGNNWWKFFSTLPDILHFHTAPPVRGPPHDKHAQIWNFLHFARYFTFSYGPSTWHRPPQVKIFICVATFHIGNIYTDCEHEDWDCCNIRSRHTMVYFLCCFSKTLKVNIDTNFESFKNILPI